MDKKILIGIIVIVIVALLAGFYALTPHYKEIKMSGYAFEVPDSAAEVKNNTVNYNTYLDTDNDLTIKTLTCKDINDINGIINGSAEIITQLRENQGTNTTYKNISLYNKSGIYTYYEADMNNSCMIIITSKDLNTIEHILETMTKTKYNIDSNQFNMTPSGLVLTNSTNNTTDNNQTTTKKATSSKSSSSSSSNSGYRWSEQYGDYIREYTDSNGIQHIDTKKGYKESYNPKTGKFKYENYDKLQ